MSSMSEVPVASAVLPGAKPPLARLRVRFWAAASPVTLIVSVLAVVAVPQLTPSVWMAPAAVRDTVVVALEVIATVTVAVALSKEQPTAALAGAAVTPVARRAATAARRPARRGRFRRTPCMVGRTPGEGWR